jgi:hypothetical protein
MQASVNALSALGKNRPHEAAEAWLGLAGRVHSEDVSEPLLASAYNNAGVACCLMSNPGDAVTHFAHAEDLWRQCRAHIATMDVPIAGRSSVFHLRLAMQHHDAFASLKRERLLHLVAAAQAITTYNAQNSHAPARGISGSPDVDPTMIDALSTAFGRGCAEARLIRETDLDDNVRSAYRSKAESLARRSEALRIGAPGFVGDLECAAQITTLLHPSLLTRAPGID